MRLEENPGVKRACDWKGQDGKDREGKGIGLSRRFFETCGLPMLQEQFPELLERIAAGLCGEGSECFGYDDGVSEDHDYDPGFCLWLSREDYENFGFRLYRAYEKLPETFEGRKKLPSEYLGRARKGVFSIPEFFIRLTGFPCPPEDPMEWFSIPEYALAQAVNGAVFWDGSGAFTEVRRGFGAGFPEDVWLKKIAARAALAAQSGQYNYERCLKHGEREAAALALSEFCGHACGLLFLLNRCYQPYYKWQFRMLPELPELQEEAGILSRLLLREYPEGKETSEAVEELCAGVARFLRKQGLSSAEGSFLEPHGLSVMEGISDGRIRNMHLMAGI